MSIYAFKTEVSQLLELITHSLYSHKEIFLRELVSNASDAIDKLRYLSISDDAYKAISFEPKISVYVDDKAKTIVVSDNGVGMSEEELAENLGTIARSGTKSFLEKLTDRTEKFQSHRPTSAGFLFGVHDRDRWKCNPQGWNR
jgi:molecular chaperone HtpG